MIGLIIKLIFQGLSIRRWNNQPRIEEFTESEHISLKLQIALIVSKILEENGKKINLLSLYKRIFWDSFFTFIYSDIKFEVKSYLKQKYQFIYKKLRKQIFDFFEKIQIPSVLLNDFQEFLLKNERNLFNSNENFEENILNFIKLIEIQLEVEHNAKFYPQVYNPILKNTQEQVNKLRKKIGFNQMKILHQYCQTSKKLKFAYRWNRLKRIYPVSVLSHLFLVFTFSYILGKIKNLDNQQLEEILTRSLLHDIPEAFTGDIITPTKKAAEGFSKALEEIESKLIQDNFKHLEKFNFYKQLKNYMLFPFKGEIGKIAKFSDNLSALFEAKIENSNYFQTVYKQLKKNLREKNDSALDYILKYGIDYFDDDVEKAWKKFIGIN